MSEADESAPMIGRTSSVPLPTDDELTTVIDNIWGVLDADLPQFKEASADEKAKLCSRVMAAMRKKSSQVVNEENHRESRPMSWPGFGLFVGLMVFVGPYTPPLPLPPRSLLFPRSLPSADSPPQSMKRMPGPRSCFRF